LLGYNGIGKLSTISILTSLNTVISRNYSIYYSIFLSEELDFACESMGICLEYSLLFEELNIFEYLQFFKLIKGFKLFIEEIVSIAWDTGL